MERKNMIEAWLCSRPAQIGGSCSPLGEMPEDTRRARNAKVKRIAFIPMIVLFLALSVRAQAQPVGSGTEADPYRIGSFDDLAWISSNSSSWGSHFIQTADIDAAVTATAGWTRIGNQTIQFEGSYDGQNHVIENLQVTTDNTHDYWGLFGRIGASGSVSNLGVIDLFYYSAQGVMSIGGIAGENNGSISNSYTTGTIDTLPCAAVGGLVGFNKGSISTSYSTCAITCNSAGGGLAGINDGSIDNSYATGSITYCDDCGGFVGPNSGTIHHSYSTGAANPGGFAYSSYNGTISNCFWNTETSGRTTSAGGTGLTTEQMQTQIKFVDAGWDFQEEKANGTKNIWGMNFTDNSGFPFLSIQGYTSFAQTPSGTGTSLDPYLIASLENLYWLTHEKLAWGSHLKQTADIDAAVTSTWVGGEGFFPIGSSTENFTGTYEGQDFKIISLTINRPAADSVGLFGYTSGSAAINGLVLQDPTITGNTDVGAFVGTSGGLSMDNCAITGGSVTGNSSNVGGLIGSCTNTLNMAHTYSTNASVTGNGNNTGGLIGYCAGALNMTDSYAANASVTGNGDNTGGLVGYCAGPLSMNTSHSSGSVIALSFTGGLIGRTGSEVSSTIENCYSSASVQGHENTGGLVGHMSSGLIADSNFSTGEVSASFYHRGGLVGRAISIEISNSYSNGNISALTDQAYYAGGLVGYADTIKISRSYSTGTISGGIRNSDGYLISGTQHGGGLVAMISQSGEIIDCHSEATIEVRGNGGGLVGDMRSGSITNSYYSTGTVSSVYQTGGLVGIATDVTISQSYSTGNVGGGIVAGGLAGKVSGSITDCYSTGDVTPAYLWTSPYDYGGFVGYSTATIANCYSTGAVPADLTKVGGFVSTNYGGTITNCFWDTETSGMTTSAGGTGKTTVEMKTTSTFTDAGWDFSALWKIDGRNNSGYPCFLCSLLGQCIAGDVNGDDILDLDDAIIALQIVAGIAPSVNINLTADGNGDGKIAIEEAIYILEKKSGIRD